MTRAIIATLATLLSTFAFAHPKSPVGYWETLNDDNQPESIVHIVDVDGAMEGTIVKYFPQPGEAPNPLCDKCPGEFKNKPIVGLKVIWGVKPDGNKWDDGHILVPKRGKLVNCSLQVRPDGTLKVRGYINFFLGDSDIWKPVPAPKG